MTAHTNLPRGVYLTLPFDAYLAEPSLSFHGVKNLLVSPLTFWADSWMNPDKTDKGTSATELGRAVHKRVLEGAVAYRAAYAVQPAKEDYPDALDGAEALRTRCAELGLTKSGTIADLCERILLAEPEAKLWPVILGKFKATAVGKELLKGEVGEQVERIARMVEAHPDAGRAFSGGLSEVSVLWSDPETGVPLKARFDYLRTQAVIDLKTFSNTQGFELGDAISRAVATQKYHVQAATYFEAVAQAKALIGAEGVRDGSPTPWLEAFLQADVGRFFFVFVETGAATNVVVRELRRYLRGQFGERTMAFETGHRLFRRGVELFAEGMSRWGEEHPWVDHQPATPFRDEEFPLYMMET